LAGGLALGLAVTGAHAGFVVGVGAAVVTTGVGAEEGDKAAWPPDPPLLLQATTAKVKGTAVSAIERAGRDVTPWMMPCDTHVVDEGANDLAVARQLWLPRSQ
jgi:hypothetical protein